MGQRITHNKLAGGVLLGAVASGFATTALWGAGSAEATCASISGINVGSGCTSTATSVAVGIGQGTTATAQGQFNTAFALGTNATATAQGQSNTAIANGTNATAVAIGTNNYAQAVGNSTGPPPNTETIVPFTGPSLIHGTTAVAAGTNNRSTAVGTYAYALTQGTGNTAYASGNVGSNPLLQVNLGPLAAARGTSSSATAIGDGSYADAVGNNTTAEALAPGSVAIAGQPDFTSRLPFLSFTQCKSGGTACLNTGNTAIATHPNGLAGATTLPGSNNNTAVNANLPFNVPSGTKIINK
jgi:hypothetical protein